MSDARETATAIVHAGLADVLAQLGETPTQPYQPRHAEKEKP